MTHEGGGGELEEGEDERYEREMGGMEREVWEGDESGRNESGGHEKCFCTCVTWLAEGAPFSGLSLCC